MTILELVAESDGLIEYSLQCLEFKYNSFIGDLAHRLLYLLNVVEQHFVRELHASLNQELDGRVLNKHGDQTDRGLASGEDDNTGHIGQGLLLQDHFLCKIIHLDCVWLKRDFIHEIFHGVTLLFLFLGDRRLHEDRCLSKYDLVK